MTIGAEVAASSAEWAKRLISKSLKLPKTTFPARCKPDAWHEYSLRCAERDYQWQQQQRPADDPFVLQDGPPYANGALHVGHALNKVLKDMIVRHKVQQGRRVVYVPGWDCHGLPIELKAVGGDGAGPRKLLSPLATRQSARKLASDEVVRQMAGFKSFAVMADWDRRWTTMDAAYELKQLGLFQRMVGRGLIHRKYRPVYWSPSSGTALAEAELEYKDDHISRAAYVKLPVVEWKELDGAGLLDGIEQLFVAVWTTTPWTLPANKAVAVRDDMDYCILRVGSQGVVVAESQVAQVAEKCFAGHPSPDIAVQGIKGQQLRSLRYTNPLLGRNAPPQPIIHADFVSENSGTGLVHCAPGHGAEDYDVCTRLDIAISAPVDDQGKFTGDAYPPDPTRLEGLDVLSQGSSAVLQLLDMHVLATEQYRHKYPYDWRTKQPVIVRATAQWFADVASIRDGALRALEDVQFIPQAGKNRLRAFVEERSEWCISRQRAWGVPIPALYDANGEAVMTAETVRHIASVVEERGIDRWWSDDADDAAWIPPQLRGTGSYRRGTDTMDVWLDSGSSWALTGQQADAYLEGTDQHRGWFQSSLLTWVAAAESQSNEAPFRALITHGFTLDGHGRKMSKSLGNIVTPEDIMRGTYLASWNSQNAPESAAPQSGQKKKKAPAKQTVGLGPDALRLWVAGSDFRHDVVLSAPGLAGVEASLIKLRTTLKMLLGVLHPSARTAPLTALDHIAALQLRDTMADVAGFYDACLFSRAVAAISRWVNTSLSAFYLEASKDRLYCGDGGGVAEPLFWGLLRMLAPVTPVLVEEAWVHLPQWLKEDPATIHPVLQLWDAPLVDDARFTTDEARLRADMPLLFAAQQAVNQALERARTERYLTRSLDCEVRLSGDEGALAVLAAYGGDELATIFNVSGVHLHPGMPQSGEALAGPWPLATATFAADPASSTSPKCTVTLVPPTGAKCPRCWRCVAPSENQLCGRCEDAFGEFAASLSAEEVADARKGEPRRAATAA